MLYHSIAGPRRFFLVCQPVWNRNRLASWMLSIDSCSTSLLPAGTATRDVAGTTHDTSLRTNVKYSTENWLRWCRNFMFCLRMLVSIAGGIFRRDSFFSTNKTEIQTFCDSHLVLTLFFSYTEKSIFWIKYELCFQVYILKEVKLVTSMIYLKNVVDFFLFWILESRLPISNCSNDLTRAFSSMSCRV